MFQNKIPLLLLLAFTGLSLSGQEIVIAEGDVLQRTLEANTDLKISEADFLQARAEYRQTRAVFLPSITASHTGFTTTNPLMVFGSKLNQQIVQASDFDPDLLNDPERIDNFATRLEVYQPVVQISGLHQRRAARLKMEATALERERNRDYLALEAHKAYMQLQLAYQGVARRTIKAPTDTASTFCWELLAWFCARSNWISDSFLSVSYRVCNTFSWERFWVARASSWYRLDSLRCS